MQDNRYFRDSRPGVFEPEDAESRRGDVLGEKQWAWLEKQLADSEADVIFIGSGIQNVLQVTDPFHDVEITQTSLLLTSIDLVVNGDLTVDSTKGEGSTFTLILPAVDDTEFAPPMML